MWKRLTYRDTGISRIGSSRKENEALLRIYITEDLRKKQKAIMHHGYSEDRLKVYTLVALAKSRVW